MPKFKVEQTSKYNAEETFSKIKTMLENDSDLRRMDSGYKCDFNGSALTGSAKGSKFQAELKVTSTGPGAQVEIEVDLPFMLTPIKGVVQSTLQKKLDSALV